MSEKEKPSISIEDFMALDEAKVSERPQYSDEDYLGQLTTKEARNAAFVAQKLGVTPYTVERRLKKLDEKILIKYSGTDPFFVLKPEKTTKASKGVEI